MIQECRSHLIGKNLMIKFIELDMIYLYHNDGVLLIIVRILDSKGNLGVEFIKKNNNCGSILNKALTFNQINFLIQYMTCDI